MAGSARGMLHQRINRPGQFYVAELDTGVALWVPLGWTFALYTREKRASLAMWLPHVSSGMAQEHLSWSPCGHMEWHMSAATEWFAVRGSSSGLGALARGYDGWARSLARPVDDASGSPSSDVDNGPCRPGPAALLDAHEQETQPAADMTLLDGTAKEQLTTPPSPRASVHEAEGSAPPATPQQELLQAFEACLGATPAQDASTPAADSVAGPSE